MLEKEIFNDIKVVYPGRDKELEAESSDMILYKIHGDIDDPVSIVLTHSQYYDFMNGLEYFKSKLYIFFASNTILMLDYSFRDINIHDIYFQYRRDYGRFLNKKLLS